MAPKKKASSAPKKVTLRPIPAGSLIRNPNAPRPATWRKGKAPTRVTGGPAKRPAGVGIVRRRRSS
jgi:hypothetical protein